MGALSLIRKNCSAFGVYFGVPARRVSDRSRKLLELEAKVQSYRRRPAEGEGSRADRFISTLAAARSNFRALSISTSSREPMSFAM